MRWELDVVAGARHLPDRSILRAGAKPEPTVKVRKKEDENHGRSTFVRHGRRARRNGTSHVVARSVVLGGPAGLILGALGGSGLEKVYHRLSGLPSRVPRQIRPMSGYVSIAHHAEQVG
jgi:hypothetical protein